MTAFSSPMTWTSSLTTVSQFNTEIRDNIKNIDERLTVSGITSPSALNKIKSARCGVRCTSSVAISANDGADKTLTWDGEDYDTDGFHSTSSSTHRITIPSGLDGTYLFTAHIAFEANSSGYRQAWIEDSGAIVRTQMVQIAASGSVRHEMLLTMVQSCSAGDWFAVHVTQTSGSARTADIQFTRSHFGAWRLFAA